MRRRIRPTHYRRQTHSVAATVVWTSLYTYCCCSRSVVPLASASLAPLPNDAASSSSLWDSAWDVPPATAEEDESLAAVAAELELEEFDDLPFLDDDDNVYDDYDEEELEQLLQQEDEEEEEYEDIMSVSSETTNAMEMEDAEDMESIEPTTPTAATKTSSPTNNNNNNNNVVDDEEPWKQKDDWWKDPLTMFDENDEFIGDLEGEDGENYDDKVVASQDDEQFTPETKPTVKKGETRTDATSKEIGFRRPRLAFLKLRNNDDKDEKHPKEREDTSNKASTSINSIPLVSLAASVSSLKAALGQGALMASSVPTLGVLATMYLGKAVYEKLFRFNKKSNKNHNKQPPNDQTSESDYLSDEEVEEYNNVLINNRPQSSGDDIHYSDMEDEEESTPEFGLELDSTSSDAETSLMASDRRHSHHHHHQHNHQEYPNDDKEEGPPSSSSSSSSSPTFFTGLRSALVGGSGSRSTGVTAGGPGTGGGMLTRKVKVTVDELDFLKTQAEKALTERQAMEQEYEKTSFKLQEAQSEASQLASTTKYLKSQLKDYEEMMDRTIRNERRKSKEEVLRMKQIMESNRMEEREMMRRQFLKELEKVQTQYEMELAEREAQQQAQQPLMRGGANHTEEDVVEEENCLSNNITEVAPTNSEPVENEIEEIPNEAERKESRPSRKRVRKSERSSSKKTDRVDRGDDERT